MSSIIIRFFLIVALYMTLANHAGNEAMQNIFMNIVERAHIFQQEKRHNLEAQSKGNVQIIRKYE